MTDPSDREQPFYPPADRGLEEPQSTPPATQQGFGNPPAPATSGMYLDQASGLLLPEGTQLASAGRRIGAYFLSIVLAIVTLFVGYLIWA